MYTYAHTAWVLLTIYTAYRVWYTPTFLYDLYIHVYYKIRLESISCKKYTGWAGL